MKNFIFTSLLKSALIACFFVNLFGYYQVTSMDDQSMQWKLEGGRGRGWGEEYRVGSFGKKPGLSLTRATSELYGFGQSNL